MTCSSRAEAQRFGGRSHCGRLADGRVRLHKSYRVGVSQSVRGGIAIGRDFACSGFSDSNVRCSRQRRN